MDSFTYYSDLAAKHPPLSLDEERALMREISAADDPRTRAKLVERLVRHNVRLAIVAARDVVRYNELMDEAIHVAVGEMFKLAHRVSDQGRPFAAWALARLRGELKDFAASARVVVVTKYGRSLRAGKAQDRQHRRDTSIAIREGCNVVSLDAKAYDSSSDSSPTYADILEDVDGESPAMAAMSKVDIEFALGCLSKPDAYVIKHRFGIECAPQKLEDIALALGCSAELVRLKERSALSRLRSVLSPEASEVCS